MKEGKTSKLRGTILTVLMVIAVLVAIFLAGSRISGFKVYNVVSGSMKPTYNVGDLIYVKPTAFEDIHVGDPITFVLNEELVVATHRVVRIDAEHQRFYTKGDANQIEDADPVHYKNVIGVPKFAIPLLGYVSDFIQHPPGTYITIGIGVLLILALFLPELISKKAKKKEEKKETSETIN